VVEQPDVLFHKGDAQLLSRLEYSAIILAARRRGNVLCAAPGSPEDVVDEREEGVRADGYALQLIEPGLALLCREGLWDLTFLEVGLKVFAFDARVGDQAATEQIDSVGLGRALRALLPLEAESALVETHPPVVGFVASKTGAVDTS